MDIQKMLGPSPYLGGGEGGTPPLDCPLIETFGPYTKTRFDDDANVAALANH